MTVTAPIPEHQATFHGTANVPVAEPEESAAAARSRLAGRRFDAAGHVVVLVDGRAVGLVGLEALLAAPDVQPLAEVMRAEPPSVPEDTDQEVAAHLMIDAGLGCLVVTGDGGEFRGLITAESMLAVLLQEHQEDLARIGGYTAGATRSHIAAEEPIGRRLRHRLPWLLVGLAGAMVSALLMGAFEQRLEANVLIALFVPAIVYMAGAVGSQTQTVLIRAFAVGVTTRQILFRELFSGVLMGVIIGLAFLVFSAVIWGDAEVALAVGVALVASTSVAVAVALVLPSLFQRLGLDPAFGSGPLATLIQDLLSIGAYFLAVILIVS